jgi:hypothetical protein
MTNDVIEVKVNENKEYEIYMNGGRIMMKKYNNKIDAMQNAIKIGKENPNETDIIIRSDGYEG